MAGNPDVRKQAQAWQLGHCSIHHDSLYELTVIYNTIKQEMLHNSLRQTDGASTLCCSLGWLLWVLEVRGWYGFYQLKPVTASSAHLGG